MFRGCFTLERIINSSGSGCVENGLLAEFKKKECRLDFSLPAAGRFTSFLFVKKKK
ncbi:MAG: hypothetical protein ACI8ZN_001527 [Bacteroidia bacterium]|jgi:hypothetical protein